MIPFVVATPPALLLVPSHLENEGRIAEIVPPSPKGRSFWGKERESAETCPAERRDCSREGNFA